MKRDGVSDSVCKWATKKSVRKVAFLVCLIAGLCQPHGALAGARAAPALTPAAPPPSQPGFPVNLSGSFSERGAPTLADLDGNGTLEIIIGSRTLNGDGSLGCQGIVYVYNSNGTLKWQRVVRADVNSSAATADLNNDGVLDVVFGMGNWIDTYPDNDCDGGLVALNGVNGNILWYFDTADYGENNAPNGRLDGVQSAPAIADIDGNGVLDIVFAAWDQCIYRLNAAGQSLWGALPYYNTSNKCNGRGFWVEDTIWSSPALADLDADGILEIVIGTDITADGSLGYPNGGILFVLSPSGAMLARKHFPQAFYSSPVIADLDGDGLPNIVIGSGPAFPNAGNYIVFARYDPALPLGDRLVVDWQPATTGRGFAAPALGDLNGDGHLDVVITAFNGIGGSFPYPTPMYVMGFDFRNRTTLFTRQLCNAWGQSNLISFGHPLVANVAGGNNTAPEIVLGYQPNVVILNANGRYYTSVPAACNDNVPPTTNLEMTTGHMFGTPAIGDLDNDGDNEIVATGIAAGNQGRLFVWSGFSKNPSPWPTFRRTVRQEGLLDNMPPLNPGLNANPAPGASIWRQAQPITITFSPLGRDYGSGLAGYSIVWDQNATTTPDTSIELARTATLVTHAPGDGQWYFHLRALDRHGNASATTRVGPFRFDSVAPRSAASSPALVTGASIPVTWTGTDNASGIVSYTVQVRVGAGAWSNWLTLVPSTTTSAAYSPVSCGQQYAFRSIARDRAGNVETEYTAAGDTRTFVGSAHAITGRVFNNRGQPVFNANISSAGACHTTRSGGAGEFTLYFGVAGTNSITVSRAGFGALHPLTGLPTGSSQIVVLPPLDNVLSNSFFETGSLAGWTATNALLFAPGHSGNGSARLSGTASLSQGVASAPAGGIVSLVYRVAGGGPSDRATLRVVAGATELTRTLAMTATQWSHVWLDVSALAGQPATIVVETTGGALDLYVDEITLGTAAVGNYPLWMPVIRR